MPCASKYCLHISNFSFIFPHNPSTMTMSSGQIMWLGATEHILGQGKNMGYKSTIGAIL